MSDDEFLSSFEARTLAPEHFKHLGHLRLAWICLQRYPFDDAVVRVCHGIRAYATQLGAADKFHWTITEALLHLMLAAGAADRQRDWVEFVAGNEALFADARACVGAYYSDLCLNSDAARVRFVGPDRAPLPKFAVQATPT